MSLQQRTLVHRITIPTACIRILVYAYPITFLTVPPLVGFIPTVRRAHRCVHVHTSSTLAGRDAFPPWVLVCFYGSHCMGGGRGSVRPLDPSAPLPQRGDPRAPGVYCSPYRIPTVDLFLKHLEIFAFYGGRNSSLTTIVACRAANISCSVSSRIRGALRDQYAQTAQQNTILKYPFRAVERPSITRRQQAAAPPPTRPEGEAVGSPTRRLLWALELLERARC